MYTVGDDLESVIEKLEQALITKQVALHTIFQESMSDISDELFQVDIITRGVQRSPSYDAIINQFVGGMKCKQTQRDLEEHCKKFIAALTNVGGPVKDAALMIQKDWVESGIELHS